MTEEKKAVKKPTVLVEGSYARNVWRVKPENEVNAEDLLSPDYWAHIASKLRAGDIIEAVPDDRHYFAQFFVLAASTNWAKIVLLQSKILIEEEEEVVTDGPIVKWGGRDKWRIIHGSEVLSKGHDDKAEAQKWLKDHLKEIR